MHRALGCVKEIRVNKRVIHDDAERDILVKLDSACRPAGMLTEGWPTNTSDLLFQVPFPRVPP